MRAMASAAIAPTLPRPTIPTFNRLQLWLFADGTSGSDDARQSLRLYFSAFAGILMTILRRAGLQGTALAEARTKSTQMLTESDPTTGPRLPNSHLRTPKEPQRGQLRAKISSAIDFLSDRD